MSKAKRSIVYSLLIQIQLRSTASSYFLFFRVSQYQVISILFSFSLHHFIIIIYLYLYFWCPTSISYITIKGLAYLHLN